MNISYLIDTDWIIHYLHGNKKIVRRLTSLKKEGLAISSISLAEVYEGVYYSLDPISSENGLNNLLKGISTLNVNEGIAKVFGKQRGKLRKEGKLINDFDLLITSTAIHHNLTVLTNNRKHFERIEGLNIISIH